MLGGGEAIDHAAQKADESLDKARAIGSALLAESNDAAKARLDQVDQIQRQALDRIVDLKNSSVADVVRILDDATQKANTLEQAISADLDAKIRAIECGGRVFVNQDVKNALGKFGRLIGLEQIVISLPLREKKDLVWTTDEHAFTIKEPFGQTYIDIRDYLLANVGQSSESNSAHQVVATYEYIASLAARTTCFYQGSTEVYNQEFINYRDKAKRWRDLLDIEVTSNAQ